MKARILKWLVAGIASGGLLGLMDSAILAVDAKEMFFTSVEMLRAMLYSTLACVLFGGLAALPCILMESAMMVSAPKWRPAIPTVVLTPLLIALLWLLTSGPQAAALPYRTGLVTIGGFIAAAGTGWVLSAVSVIADATRRRWAAIGSAVLAAGIIFVDYTILVRLYLPFHLALTLIAWLLLTFTFLLMRKSPELALRHPMIWFVFAGLLLVSGTLAVHQIRGTQNIRFVIGEKTVSATDVVLLAKILAPPATETVLDTASSETSAEKAPPAAVSQLKRPRASVLLITVDAMRYDRVLFDNTEAIAPTIHKLAKEGVVFKRAYTALPHTSYAVASFITGKYIKPLFEIPEVTADQETLPEIMKRFRYRTGGFFTRSVFFIDRARFKPLEDKGYGFGYLKMEYRFTAEQKVNQALEFLEKVKPMNGPVFTWVHLFEPHEPYLPDCTRFGVNDVQRYDCEIYTADQQIKRLVDYVEENFPGTIIVLAADHGEEFNDHGGKYHGTTLYDEQARVPLLIRVVGVPHRIVSEPVSMVDIAGTILSIVDIPVPPRVRSNNLSGLMLGADTESRAAFSQLHDQRMVVFKSHKLIWDKSSDLCQLYDLEKDPRETISIADQHPDMVAQLKQKIGEWEASHAKAELRPVSSEDGMQSWPEALQRAIGGDESAAPELTAYIASDTPEVVRQKAAELIYEMRQPGQFTIPVDKVDDPVCLSWIWAALASERPTEVTTALNGIVVNLTPQTPSWIRAQMTRLRYGDLSAIEPVIQIAANGTLAPAIRIEAIQLLGEKQAHVAESTLLNLLDDYLLRQEVAAALARLKSKRAIVPMQAHLSDEPFTSRRAELAEALMRIDCAKSFREVALQMTLPTPIPNGLALLSSCPKAIDRQVDIANPENSRHVSIIKGTRLQLKTNTVQVAYVQSGEQTATLKLMCNGEETASLTEVPPDTLQTVSLSSCSAADGGITLSLETSTAPPPVFMAVW